MVKEEIMVKGEYEEIFERCRKAMKSIRAGITSEDKEKGEIKGVRALSLTSWGERLTITIAPAEESFRITIESSPLIFDWSGKNKKNVDLLKSYIKGKK
jgi:hypothetical protein